MSNRTYQDCLSAIEKAAGRPLADDELESLLEGLQTRQRYLAARDTTLSTRDAALKAADDMARDLEQAAIIEKRNAAINFTKRVERVEWIQRNFGTRPAEGLEAMLVGVNRAREGARDSAAAQQVQLRNTYHAGLVADIERAGNMRLLASGTMDRDISRALWAIGRDDEATLHASLPAEAVELARVLNKWQEVSRLDANEAGAWIGKEAGYITRQSHDAEKIKRAGYDAWRAAAIEKFDLPRMAAQAGTSDMEPILKGIWTNLASGNHMKATADVSGFKGPGNLAKKLSQDRTIHFKDADGWFDYNQQFGTGNLRESIVAGLSHSADATGLMRVMGTNPVSMLDTIKSDLLQEAKAAGKLDQVTKLQEAGLDKFMSAVDGSMNIPGNALWARRSANIRSIESMAKLGGMILSQLNDIAVYGSGTSYQGRGFLSGMGEAVRGLGRNLKPQETRELVSALGVVLDNQVGEMGRIGTFAESGSMARAMQLFMKLNLGSWWTNKMRASAALGMSHHMALQADKPWGSLGAEYQRVLSLYSIDEARWDGIRAGAQKQVDGKSYIVPENIEDPRTADALRTYLTDQTSFLALEPDAKTKAYMLQGSQPGTWTGEMFRFLMQFKSFTGAYMQKIVGRELLGRGYEGDGLLKALVNGKGEFQGLAQIIVTSTLLGYASMSLKDLAKGKTPRDPTESPEQGVSVLLAALLQGGGAGIYGDFLFGQASRMGSGTLETLAGPTLSSAGRIVDLYHKGLAGDDVAARSVNEAINNTPFLNLFYLRAALNYAVLYRLQEGMNPGYLRRMERQAAKENNQTFLLRPSEFAQ